MSIDPFLRYLQVNDSDTLLRTRPDSTVLLHASGSWGTGAFITLGDVRSLVSDTKQPTSYLSTLKAVEAGMMRARLAAADVDDRNGDRSTADGRSLFPCNQAVVDATQEALDAVRVAIDQIENQTSELARAKETRKTVIPEKTDSPDGSAIVRPLWLTSFDAPEGDEGAYKITGNGLTAPKAAEITMECEENYHGGAVVWVWEPGMHLLAAEFTLEANLVFRARPNNLIT